MAYLSVKAFDLIQELTGIEPDTTSWVRHIEFMTDNMKLTHDDVLAAIKIAAKDPYHKPGLMDSGLGYIRYNYHKITMLRVAPRDVKQVQVEKEKELWKVGKHRRWEVAIHQFTKDYLAKHGTISSVELHKFSDLWYQTHRATAEDWVECPVCIDEITSNMLNQREATPVKEMDFTPLVRKLSMVKPSQRQAIPAISNIDRVRYNKSDEELFLAKRSKAVPDAQRTAADPNGAAGQNNPHGQPAHKQDSAR